MEEPVVAAAAAAVEGGDGQDENDVAASLSRRELQKTLKSWKVLATGTTEALRQRYREERLKRLGAQAAGAVAPASAAPATAAAGGTITAVVSLDETARPNEATPHAHSPENNHNNNARSDETRLRRYRSSCPTAIKDRIKRALTQRLFLVQNDSANSTTTLEGSFVVLGSTGNVYTVKVSHIPSCTCPDHARGHLCKHILFVLLKVMRLPPDSPLIYQAAWTSSELKEMFHCLEARRVGGTEVMANDQVRSAYAKLKEQGSGQAGEKKDEEEDVGGVKRKSLEEDSDCPICFDSLTATNEPLTYCRAACGANFHASCIERWGKMSGQRQITCPNCRQPWEDATSKKAASAKGPGKEGYANFGQLQGQSAKRDTSTYHSWSPAGRKRGRYG